MLAVILDYAFMGGGLLAILAASLAAFVYLPVPLKGYILMGLAGAAMALLAYSAGYHKASVRCDEATARFQQAIQARDARINNHAAELSQSLQEAANRSAQEIDQKVRDYEKQLKERPSCRLDGPDADRLRSIK